MKSANQTDLQHLTKSIASIRRVVRRQVYLPLAIQSIKAIKKKNDNFKPLTALETIAQRLARLQSAITDIRSVNQRNRLPRIISNLRKTLNYRFESEEKSQYLLLHEALSGRGLPLAALSICGKGTREIRYTQLLRYFLDPNELHGCGARVLTAVLGPELKRSALSQKEIEWNEAEVKAEFNLGTVKTKNKEIGCAVDLFIRLDNYVVMIENKINSSESGKVSSGEISQLRRYSAALNINFPKFADKKVVKIYLTPDHRSPIEDLEWAPLSYDDVIRRTTEVLSEHSLSKVGRYNLCCFLWDLLTGPLYVDRSSTDKLLSLITDTIEHSEKHVFLKRWCRENAPLIKPVLKIVEACYV